MSSVAKRFIVNMEVALGDGERFLLIVRGAEESHAAGTLSLVGGKVDMVAHTADVLEQTARREVGERNRSGDTTKQRGLERSASTNGRTVRMA